MIHTTLQRAAQRALFLVVPLMGVVAQERERISGRVHARDGSPWSGAHVVLGAEFQPAAPELGGFDRIEVTADAEGMFQAMLLPHLAYVVWAAERGADGVLRHAKPVCDVYPGATVDLRESRPLDNPRLVVQGLEAWGDARPTRVRLYPRMPGVPPEMLELDESGSTDLPAWPDVAFATVILGSDGQPLYMQPWGTRVPMSKAVFDANGRVFKIAIPPPRSATLSVEDDSGVPIANARIRQRVGTLLVKVWPGRHAQDLRLPIWREGPLTDAEGRATIRFAPVSDPFGLTTERQDGLELEASLAGFGRAKNPDRSQSGDGDMEAIRFVLNPAEPITAILVNDDQPLAGYDVAVEATPHHRGMDPWTYRSARAALRTDDSGMIRMPAVHGRHADVHVQFELPPNIRELWADTADAPLCRWFRWFPDRRNREPEGQTLDIARFRHVRVHVSNPRGISRPRASGRVVLLADWLDDAEPDVTSLAFFDEVGQTDLRLPPGRYGLVATFQEEFVAHEFVVEDDSRPLDLAIEPQRYATMTIRVRTPDGHPESVTVVAIGSSRHDPMKPLDRVLACFAHSLAEGDYAPRDGLVEIRTFPGLIGPTVIFRIFADGCRPSRDFRLLPNSHPALVRLEASR